MIHNDDCLQIMKTFEENSVDAIVTDPPYGLNFMGKKWDYEVPSVEIWKEVLRVLKPGGHLLSFGGTRTYHRMVVNIEDAGFEIRDQLQWLYGSGFPKSHNLSGEHEGWGSALKPANEPVVLARKPLEKGLTIAENVLKYGTGALNIDASRVCMSQFDPKEYLIKLITPPNGIVLDPFMGSGSTGVAAKKLNYEFIGIEISKEYADIAEKRMEA